jgi:hypothetical protein
MTLPSATLGNGPDRFFDALIGGGVALVVSQAVLGRRPTSVVTVELDRTLSELTLALQEASQALMSDAIELAYQALARLRGLDPDVSRLYEALATAQEAAALSPVRRRARGQLEPYGEAARHVDYAVRNARVLMRAVASGLRTRVAVEPGLAEALATLADCADALRAQLVDGADAALTRSLAVRASEQATEILALQNDLRTSMIIGQIRATAVDLMRASGLDAEAARSALPAAPSEEI